MMDLLQISIVVAVLVLVIGIEALWIVTMLFFIALFKETQDKHTRVR